MYLRAERACCTASAQLLGTGIVTRGSADSGLLAGSLAVEALQIKPFPGTLGEDSGRIPVNSKPVGGCESSMLKKQPTKLRQNRSLETYAEQPADLFPQGIFSLP